MMLYLNGQDIDRLVLGLVDRRGDDFVFAVAPQGIACSAETFLAAVVSYLGREGLEQWSLTGIIVVSGGGSSTGLRVTHALANAWAFAGAIPLYSLHKTKDGVDDLNVIDHSPKTFVRPEYERAPHITLSKKDALRR